MDEQVVYYVQGHAEHTSGYNRNFKFHSLVSSPGMATRAVRECLRSFGRPMEGEHLVIRVDAYRADVSKLERPPSYLQVTDEDSRIEGEGPFRLA